MEDEDTTESIRVAYDDLIDRAYAGEDLIRRGCRHVSGMRVPVIGQARRPHLQKMHKTRSHDRRSKRISPPTAPHPSRLVGLEKTAQRNRRLAIARAVI